MSQSPESFILAQTISPVETGQEFSRMPPHMTVLTWFAIDRSQLDGLFPVIEKSVAEHGDEAKEASALERAMFGPNKDIPVCKMAVKTEAIHKSVFSWVEAHGGSFSSEDFARNWAPHITDEEGQALQPNDYVRFSSIALFSRQNSEEAKMKVVEYSQRFND